jgi:predicted nucleotidyltransferase
LVKSQRHRYHSFMPIKALKACRREILELAARHGARNARVSGSFARGDDRATSDVDLLVDMEPGRTLLDLVGLEQDLEAVLGRPVEVLTEGGLSPYLQQRILAEASVL